MELLVLMVILVHQALLGLLALTVKKGQLENLVLWVILDKKELLAFLVFLAILVLKVKLVKLKVQWKILKVLMDLKANVDLLALQVILEALALMVYPDNLGNLVSLAFQVKKAFLVLTENVEETEMLELLALQDLLATLSLAFLAHLD
jgi:hypothetical protein